MKVFVVGSGAREHALVERIAQEVGTSNVACAPGNPGIGRLVQTVDIPATDVQALATYASNWQADLVVVGPELPLSLGLADLCRARSVTVFGPSAAAARLESSKAFAKAFMKRHAVPTAQFHTSHSFEDARALLEEGRLGWPVVVKADGLAAGKGVVVASALEEAIAAARTAMSDLRFGDAGRCVVLEECLSGPEVSFFVVSDGERAMFIGSAQDHKRIFEGDRGPNTGGMGAFAPSPLIDPPLRDRVMREIVTPVLSGMAAEGTPFVGFLYVGLMLTADGPKVIEFNARLGDPEAQVILPLIQESLVELLLSAARGALPHAPARLRDSHCAGVVLASRGYPDSAESGQVIRGIDDASSAGAQVYQASTALRANDVVTAGGRVLTVVGRGASLRAAIDKAYLGVEKIGFDGMQFRRDIGRSAL